MLTLSIWAITAIIWLEAVITEAQESFIQLLIVAQVTLEMPAIWGAVTKIRHFRFMPHAEVARVGGIK